MDFSGKAPSIEARQALDGANCSLFWNASSIVLIPIFGFISQIRRPSLLSIQETFYIHY